MREAPLILLAIFVVDEAYPILVEAVGNLGLLVEVLEVKDPRPKISRRQLMVQDQKLLANIVLVLVLILFLFFERRLRSPDLVPPRQDLVDDGVHFKFYCVLYGSDRFSLREF